MSKELEKRVNILQEQYLKNKREKEELQNKCSNLEKEIKNLKQLKNESNNLPDFNFKCISHSKIYNSYCKTCKINICNICSGHSSHQVISFSKLGMTNNEINKMEILLKNFDENIRKTDVVKRNIKSFFDQAKLNNSNTSIYENDTKNNFIKFYIQWLENANKKIKVNQILNDITRVYSTQQYEKNVYLSMVAEQCEYYDDMYNYLEDMVKFDKDRILSSDERNLLSIAMKNKINKNLQGIRTVSAYMNKEKKKETSTYLPYLIEYNQKLMIELEENCKKYIELIDLFLLPKASTDESMVFYYKMKGDYYRRMAEGEGNLKKEGIEGAKKSYDNALKYVKSLGIINPIRLGLLLNLSVFYYEYLGNSKKAIEICKNAIKESEKDLKNADEEDDEVKDAVSIINLMKENLDMWESE